MTIPMGIVTYITIWWIVLFAVLPFGVRSQHEDGKYAKGTDPGAPVVPRLLAKALWTTGIAAVIFAALLYYIDHYA